MAKTTIELDAERRDRINSMIYSSSGKKVFKSADAVVKFLFEQYDDKIKNKLSSLTNKESDCVFKIPKQALEDSGLKPGDELKITVEGDKIIIEKFK